MNFPRAAIRSVLAALVSLLFLLGVTVNAADSKSGSRPTDKSGQPAGAAAGVVDACTFIPKAELEQFLGWELRDGKPKDVSPGMSQCDFTTPPDAYVTRRYPNPPLPKAAGFSSVVITTFPTTPQSFAENRRVTQAGGVYAGDISFVGDAAFFNGPAMIFARVGNRGFSIRLYVEPPTTQAGKTRLEEVLLSVARLGAAKLGYQPPPQANLPPPRPVSP